MLNDLRADTDHDSAPVWALEDGSDREAWREVEGKLSHFVEPRPSTFNWLTMEGDIEVLISMDGKW